MERLRAVRPTAAIVFPGQQTETWTWQPEARAWSYHRFYGFQPDLNWSNPAVREEIKKVTGFWLQLGASGFRVDGAPFVLEQTEPSVNPPPKDFTILDDWRQDLQWRRGDAVLLCEVNVEPGDIPAYFTSHAGGPNDRAHLMFSFLLNPRMWLALARSDAEPMIEALRTLPTLPAMAQWATFLHNLADRPVTADLGDLASGGGRPRDVFTDADYAALGGSLGDVPLNGWGYRWIRLRRDNHVETAARQP